MIVVLAKLGDGEVDGEANREGNANVRCNGHVVRCNVPEVLLEGIGMPPANRRSQMGGAGAAHEAGELASPRTVDGRNKMGASLGVSRMARRAAEELSVPFLGEIPLDPEIRIASDEGRPVAARGSADPIARPYFDVAGLVTSEITRLNAARPDPLPVL